MPAHSRQEQSFVKRVVLAALPVVAFLSVSMLARPGDAAAAENVLTGKPRIGTVRAMIPQRGRDAGRLVVWVRLDHAAGTLRGVRRERPETVHTGRVMARVGGASRITTQRLDLDRRRIPGGYFMRFPKPTAKAVAAGVARRVPVSLSVAQTVDLDSDGDAEERAAIAATRRVALATPATLIQPKDGSYNNTPGDLLNVNGGYITGYGFVSATDGPCRVGPGNEAYAPIDPQTGRFGFLDKLEGYGPTTDVGVNGRFTDDKNATVFATIGVPDKQCEYNIQDNDFKLFQWPPEAPGGQ
jgi:hypothetical protein